MILWHVTTKKKLSRYLAANCILPPVRAWTSVSAAERFSKQTGRRILVRLKSNRSFKPAEGHRGEAVVSDVPYPLEGV